MRNVPIIFYCAQLAPRTTIASAVQAFTERNGPRVVSCLSVDLSLIHI